MSFRKDEGLSEQEVSQLREVFAKFDKNRRGTVPFVHIDEIIRTAGRLVADSKFKESIKNPSTDDAERRVQFPEFMGMVTSYTRPIEPATDLREAFRVFDRDGHGFITTAELRHVVTTLGERMTDEEADELIREADVTSEGHIDYEEFIKTISVPRERQDSSNRQDSYKSQDSS